MKFKFQKCNTKKSEVMNIEAQANCNHTIELCSCSVFLSLSQNGPPEGHLICEQGNVKVSSRGTFNKLLCFASQISYI